MGIAIGVWGGKLHWMWNFGGHSHRGLGGKLHWSKASIVRDWGGKVKKKKTELKDVLNCKVL